MLRLGQAAQESVQKSVAHLGCQAVVGPERPSTAFAVAERGPGIICRVQGDGILYRTAHAVSFKLETHGFFVVW